LIIESNLMKFRPKSSNITSGIDMQNHYYFFILVNINLFFIIFPQENSIYLFIDSQTHQSWLQ